VASCNATAATGQEGQSLHLECLLQDDIYSNYSMCCSIMVALPETALAEGESRVSRQLPSVAPGPSNRKISPAHEKQYGYGDS
jgi:hypothetical protein